jgi:hypothetical protein
MKKQMARHFLWLPTSSFSGFAEMTSVCMVRKQLSAGEYESTRWQRRLRSYLEVIVLDKEDLCLHDLELHSATLAG